MGTALSTTGNRHHTLHRLFSSYAHTIILLWAHERRKGYSNEKRVCGVYCQWFSMPCPFIPNAATTT
jgi:hypothetical protein